MKISSFLVSSLLSLSLLSGFLPGKAHAQMSATNTNTSEFRSIDQPLGLKLGVSATGLSLIGLELWWFLFKETKA